MARGRKLRAAAAAALLALAPLSCVTPPDERGSRPPVNTRPDEFALTQTLEAMLRALEEENGFAFLEHVSDRFVPSRLGLKSEVDIGLERFLGYGYHVRYDRVHLEDGRGTMVVEWKLVRMRRDSSDADIQSGQTELRFIREDDRWMLEAMHGTNPFAP